MSSSCKPTVASHQPLTLEALLLDFRITSRCPYGCQMCYRNPGIVDLPTDGVQRVLKRLRDAGVSKIGITGGEPSVREDYISLIRYAKTIGYTTYLSTVGRTFLRDMRYLDGFLDWVGLPLDSISPSICSQLRSPLLKDQPEIVLAIMRRVIEKPPAIHTKLTTVVAQPNIYHLPPLVQALLPFVKGIGVWRFYQFVPLGIGAQAKYTLAVNTEAFLEAMRTLQLQFPSVPISWATAEERDRANVIVEPNGDIIIPDGETYTYLCNAATDDPSVVTECVLRDNTLISKCVNNRRWLL